MKALCYLILKSFSRKSERLGQIFDGFDVITLIYKKLNLTLLNFGGGRYLETTKKIGHKKVSFLWKFREFQNFQEISIIFLDFS